MVFGLSDATPRTSSPPSAFRGQGDLRRGLPGRAEQERDQPGGPQLVNDLVQRAGHRDAGPPVRQQRLEVLLDLRVRFPLLAGGEQPDQDQVADRGLICRGSHVRLPRCQSMPAERDRREQGLQQILESLDDVVGQEPQDHVAASATRGPCDGRGDRLRDPGSDNSRRSRSPARANAPGSQPPWGGRLRMGTRACH